MARTATGRKPAIATEAAEDAVVAPAAVVPVSGRARPAAKAHTRRVAPATADTPDIAAADLAMAGMEPEPDPADLDLPPPPDDPVEPLPSDAGPRVEEVEDRDDPALPGLDPGVVPDEMDPAVDPVTGDVDDDAPVSETDLEAVAKAADEEEDEEDDDLPPVSNRVAPRMPGHMPGVPNRPIMHARLPAKAEIFHEGDHVVYPTHGVGKVERIATEEIAGHKLELIHITFEENRMTLRVPVSKARSAGLRKLATRKMFDDAMAVLKGRARIKRTMWSRRAQEYEAKINSGDPLAIAEVVRDLHRNAGQPDQSFSERQIYEAAMDRLAAELAALDKTDKGTAAAKLGDFLKTV